jgi:aryl-alcohol dehydrogenase-like predicted oxidoreductase
VAADHAREDIEASLQALDISTIDLYWLHRDNPALPAEEIIEFMQPFVAEGKVRHLGVANWPVSRLAAANTHAARHGLHPFVANQPLFNLGSWDLPPASDPTLVTLDRDAYAYHQNHPVALIPYSAQAQGYFCRHLAGRTLSSQRYDSPRNRAVAQLVGKLAGELDVPLNAIVLAYLTHQPLPIVPIIGPNSVQQLDDAFAALTVCLCPVTMNRLEEACGSGLQHGGAGKIFYPHDGQTTKGVHPRPAGT